MKNLNHIIIGSGKKKVIFLHGFMGSSSDWLPILTNFNSEYSFLLIDLPGHGKSINLNYEMYDFEQNSYNIIKIINNTNFQNSSIYGYSMGGRVAIHLCIKYSKYFKKLIIESSSPGLKTEVERDERKLNDLALSGKIINSKDKFNIFLDNWYSMPLFGNIKKSKKYTQLIVNRIKNNPFELKKSLLGMGTGSQKSLWDEIRNISIPTIHIVGELDKKYFGISKEMQLLVPNYKLIPIENIAHNVHLELGAKFYHLLNNIL